VPSSTEGRGPTRAELLERCIEAGLHATNWRKAEMAAALRRLESAPERPAAPDEDGDEPGPAEPSRPLVSGWCNRAPAWGEAHLECRRRGPRCACPCHGDGWERPEPPAGARRNRFLAP